MNMKWKVGDTTITKITEIIYPEFPNLIPAATPEVVKKVQWLFPHFVTLEGKLSVSIHSLVVDTPSAKLVVDTCIGNGRNREPFAIMSNLSTSYLEDMIAAGYHPDSINYVLCTHLHADHVGWNTRLVNGKWVPTFPRAQYLIAEAEYTHWKREHDASPPEPVLVRMDHEVETGLHLEPAVGHTPGNVVLHVQDGGKHAVLLGDVMHHPVQ